MEQRSLVQSASDIYGTVAFNTNALYNRPAPEPWISFVLGGVFFVILLVLWYYRVKKIYKHIGKGNLSKGSVRFRAWLTAYRDNDSPMFTCVKMAAQSFLFLGGLQMNYGMAFTVMLGVFAVESSCDTVHILLSFREANDLDELIATSKSVRIELNRHPVTVLEPTNVYEDLTRGTVIVSMVFITQAILIAFVVKDIYDSETHVCLDGTKGCPVTGTLGSWGIYLLGIFMACVVLLGPKTNFGMSEQNPAFWIQLFLSAKNSKNKCTWFDPVKNTTRSRLLHSNDWRIWVRFWMSYLINGVGFHILIHALPIQVAGQSSLTGVVLRAVGMLYLVDMDDTPGYKMTLVPNDRDESVKKLSPSLSHRNIDPSGGMTKTGNSGDEEESEENDRDEGKNDEEPAVVGDIGEMAVLAQKIIDDAQAQLDALSAGKGMRGLPAVGDIEEVPFFGDSSGEAVNNVVSIGKEIASE